MAAPRLLSNLPTEPLSNNEESFIIATALQTRLRLDGRRLDQSRAVRIDVSRVANTSVASARVGDTKVSCVVSAELGPPYPDRPNEGVLIVQTDIMASSGASRTFDVDLFERAITKAMDVESLCVVSGIAVWHVKCLIIVVDDFGAVVDACSLAAMSALLHFRKPDVTVVGEDITVHAMEDKAPVPLSVVHTPLALSFALLDVASHSVEETEALPTWLGFLDPTNAEETVARGGSLVVVLNAHREVCGMSESGPPLPRSAFRAVVEVAAQVRKMRGVAMEEAVGRSPFA